MRWKWEEPLTEPSITHPAQVLCAEVEVGHETKSLRHERHGAFAILDEGEQVDWHRVS